MPSPAYTSTKSPVKNLGALLTYLSVSFNPTSTVYQLIAAALHKFGTLIDSALALGGTLSVAGATTLTGALTLLGIQVESVDTRTGAGAVSVTKTASKLVTTGADALTLANGTEGQIKRIIMLTDGGDGVLTPATKTGFTTITFSAVGQSATLQYLTTAGWNIVSLNGAVAA